MSFFGFYGFIALTYWFSLIYQERQKAKQKSIRKEQGVIQMEKDESNKFYYRE